VKAILPTRVMGTAGQVRVSLAGYPTANEDNYISEKVYRELNDGKVRIFG